MYSIVKRGKWGRVEACRRCRVAVVDQQRECFRPPEHAYVIAKTNIKGDESVDAEHGAAVPTSCKEVFREFLVNKFCSVFR